MCLAMQTWNHNDTVMSLNLETLTQVAFLSLKLSKTQLGPRVPGPWVPCPRSSGPWVLALGPCL